MTTAYFVNEMARLEKVFGAANFSSEKKKLIWGEVRDLPDRNFHQIVNTCIGEFNVDYPPKVSHFREMAHGQRKEVRKQQELETIRNCNDPVKGREEYGNLKKVLQDMGVKSLMEAIKKKQVENNEGGQGGQTKK